MNQISGSTTIPTSPLQKKEESDGDKSENEEKMKMGMGYTCSSYPILWSLWGY